MALARKHGVPVRWNEDRSENAHGHDPRPRPDPAHRARRRRRRQAHRDPGPPARRHGRLPAARHARHPAARRVPVRRRLRPAEGLRLRVHVGVHDDDARPTPTAAPDAPRPRTPSSGRWTRWRPRSASTRSSCGGATSSPPTSTRTRRGAGSCTTPATTTARRPKAAELLGYDELRARQATQNVEGATKRLGIGVVVVLRDVRPGPVTGAGLAELLGRRLGGGHGAGAADVQGAGRHRHRAARPGPRDGVVDDRRRQARASAPTTSTCCTATPRSPRSGSTPTARARCRSAASRSPWRATRSSTRPRRSPPTSSEASADDLEYAGGAFSVQGLARQDDAAGGDRVRGVHGPQPARRAGAQPRGAGHLRPAELLVAVRHPHVRRRGRHRDRRTSTC